MSKGAKPKPVAREPRPTGLRMDPIRFEVMRSAFTAAADEMAAALRKAAYSTNIKTRADFSCALFDSQLRLIAQSFTQPVHLGSMPRVVPSAVGKYGVEKLGPGDALVINNPYCNAVHLNDVTVIAPFFSGNQLQGYAATIAHHVDIGGYAPGGFCISTEVYQEGVIIPVVRLVAEGKIVEDVFSLILANIRSPRQSAGDFRAQIAAALLGQKRMAEIIAKFGDETVKVFVEELIEHTERWSRQQIGALAQGEYYAEAYRDDDGVTDRPIRLVLRGAVRDGEVFFDLTGSDEQRESPMNCTLTQTYSACAYVVKCLIDPDIPTNDGFYRLVHVEAPEGTVVHARHPAGVVGGWEIAMRLCDLGFKLFSDAMPDKVMACTKSINCHMACGGRDPRDGEYYTFLETLGGGYGARPNKDGMDGVQAHFQNTENSAIEETENNLPFLVTRSPTPRQPGQFATGNAPVTQPGGGRDLSTVSNEEMEAVIAQNPNVIAMRLALAERYLGDGNFQKASEHAHVALQQNPGTTDKARALRDLGWATALLDKPAEGADLLQQSLQLEPTDQNTLFFLAKVRLDGLHDPPGAITLLQQLLATNIADAGVRKTVEDTLAQARAQASGQTPPASKP